MSTDLHVSLRKDSPQTDGGVWSQLHSEREEICEALLREPWPSDQCRAVLGETVNVDQLQKRLRLIDNALDRLMVGSYGNCVVCERRIDNDKLHADPALSFCFECQRKSAKQH